MTAEKRARLPIAKASVALCCALAAMQCAAQNYPQKPVRMVVPFSPGGSLDLVARLIAKHGSADLGQQIVVENKPGAGGNIGVETVAKAQPDGYTLLIVQNSITVNPSLMKSVPYDPVKDLEPISRVSSYMLFLVAHPSTGLKSVRQLIDLAKAHPGELTYASVGVGSGTHLSGALFAHMAGIKMTHVPYKGTGQVLPDLLGGQVALHFGSTSVVPYVKNGKLIPLGVTGEKRSTALPEVPTIAEAGLKGYEVTAWNAVFGPAGVPAPIVNRINGVVKQALSQPESRSVMDAQGLVSSWSTPQELGALVRSELAKWAHVIKIAGVRPE
ncbi:MAG: Bug family tripartite tricarboxylate transporter substrate binding protein [Rhodospirillaceae bacterium]